MAFKHNEEKICRVYARGYCNNNPWLADAHYTVAQYTTLLCYKYSLNLVHIFGLKRINTKFPCFQTNIISGTDILNE